MVRKTFTIAAVMLLLAGCSITPEPLSEADLAANADDKLARVTQEQEPVNRPISLHEAMARALKFNLDYRVELYARTLADQKLNLARSDLLPDLVANVHTSGRDSEAWSYSLTRSGVRSVDPSTSREKHNTAKDLTFSWNILDFGLSYVRAKQSADNALIAEEQKRKVINRIIEDVRTAYWRAVSADRLMSGLQKLEGRIVSALGNAKVLSSNGYSSPLAQLTFQRELLDIRRDINRLERELQASKVQLAALMNISPSSGFSIVIPERKLAALELKVDRDEMLKLALVNRPELREIAYKERINSLEAEAAMLELLPSLNLYAGANYDSNAFLVEQGWISWGAKASWNAMKLFAYPAKKAVIESETGLIDQRALETTMAIMTQVEVARLRYNYLRKSAATAGQYYDVQRRIRDQIRAGASADTTSEQTLIREEMNTLVASAEYDVAYSDLQNAFAAIYASIGADPYGDSIDESLPVSELAAQLQKLWQERGDFIR